MSRSSNEATLTAKPIGKTEIARSGKIKMMAYALKLIPNSITREQLEDANQDKTHTSTQRLLIDSTVSESPSLSIEEAHNQYGLTVEVLKRLCEDKAISAEEADGNWAISRVSLIRYIEELRRDK